MDNILFIDGDILYFLILTSLKYRKHRPYTEVYEYKVYDRKSLIA